MKWRIALMLVLMAWEMAVASNGMAEFRHLLRLRGSVEESLERMVGIIESLGVESYERWESPRCLHARFRTTTIDSIMVLVCEGMPWEKNLVLGCSALEDIAAAMDQLCTALESLYGLDS